MSHFVHILKLSPLLVLQDESCNNLFSLLVLLHYITLISLIYLSSHKYCIQHILKLHHLSHCMTCEGALEYSLMSTSPLYLPFLLSQSRFPTENTQTTHVNFFNYSYLMLLTFSSFLSFSHKKIIVSYTVLKRILHYIFMLFFCISVYHQEQSY